MIRSPHSTPYSACSSIVTGSENPPDCSLFIKLAEMTGMSP